MGESYYEVLAVDADATREEIQAAYRERVLETHPDHNDAPDAAEQFKRVSAARSVLADGAERARYDRLGHKAYARLADRTADESGTDGSSEQKSTTDSSDEATDRSTRSKRHGETAGSSTTGSKTASSSATHSSTAGSRRDARSKSHHARQRRRRQRARKHARTNQSFGGETGATGSRGGATATADDHDESASEFRYAVHDWTDDVTLEWEGESITHTTAVTIGCLWLLYPVFVGASLTSAFPLAINVVVAACTLGLVGYVLTKPRIAAALFGSWSVLFPLGIDATSAVEAYSITGLLALGFAWIPFGYALALWWALRP